MEKMKKEYSILKNETKCSDYNSDTPLSPDIVTDRAEEPTARKKIKKRATICLQNCKYPIVGDVARSMGMKVVEFPEQWDLYWSDMSMNIERVKDMKKYQKTNHFPGMSEICRKDSLARNLNRMVNSFPDDYNFFPKTWYLPSEYSKLQDYTSQHKSATYILKPDIGCQGIGIYLTKSLKNINRFEKMICQLYVSKPLLIDGYKFDMRVYTLIASCDPLKIYVYNDGLVRLATEPYKKPTNENLKNLFMHLTNYSVNKHSKMYVDNETSGSKRRIMTLNDWLGSKGYDVTRIWKRIDDVIIKTIIVAYPFVNRSYQTCFSRHNYTSACFELLGFDILLDEKCEPHLLEVNHSPSFHTDTSLDKMLKRKLLLDTFNLLQLNKSTKKLVSGEEKWKTGQRIINADKAIYKQRTLACKESCEQKNNIWESKNMGDYRLVYSEKNAQSYEHFFYQNESTLYRNTCCSLLRLESAKSIQKKLGIKLLESDKSDTKTMPSGEPIRQCSCCAGSVEEHLLKKKEMSVYKYKPLKSFRNVMAKIISKPIKEDKIVTKASSDSAVTATIKNKPIKNKNNDLKPISKYMSLPSLKINKFFVSNSQKKKVLKVKSEDISNRSIRTLRKKLLTSEAVCSNCVEFTVIAKKNKKMFPNVQSCIFNASYKKRKGYWNCWKDVFIDEIEENERLSNITDRDRITFNLDIKEYIYKAFEKYNNLHGRDKDNYTEYQKKKELLGITMRRGCSVRNITFQ